MSKLSVVIKSVDVPKVVDAVGKVVSIAKAVNSTKEYKHKDKVDKALSGAATALDVGLAVWRIFKR